MSTNSNSKKGIHWERFFSPTDDPYETIELELRDIVLKDGERVVFEQREVLVPKHWSVNATNVFAQHYLKGRQGTEERETSVPQVINRVVETTFERWAMEGRPEVGRPAEVPLFDSIESARAAAIDLKYLLISQQVGFNSPVWYNIGVLGVAQGPSACFILEVLDNMESITDWYRDEAFVFKQGSGAGLNLSNIRSSFEGLRKGGKASGPNSYARAADASAGTMASGGRVRRAAKMLVLDIDHPDILEGADVYRDGKPVPGFVRLKAIEEGKARVLAAAGYDLHVGSGKDAYSLQYQNANNSVRITNEFMECVLEEKEWLTVARQPDLVWKETPRYQAKYLWNEIAKAAWECADPGLQMDDTINHWHTTPAAGRIEASNPCSEYMHINNSPCNLANTNLVKYVDESGAWQVERFTKAVKLVALAQTVLAQFGDYPTEKIQRIATTFRQIGQGYTNLGALLMSQGLAYDSMEGRAWAAAITSLMQATLYRTSGEVAEVWGAYPGAPEIDKPGFDHPENREAHLRAAEMSRQYHLAIAKPPTAKGKKLSIRFGPEIHIETFHQEVVGKGHPLKHDANLRALWEAGSSTWDDAVAIGNLGGYANAHMSVLAPMGTNGYIQDNDTTGIEPALGLKVVKYKVSGDVMFIVCQSVEPGLRKLGYQLEQIEAILEYVTLNNSVVGAPALREEHYHIFDTSFADGVAKRFLRIDAHLLMMAAPQPFISGAISKTGNLPNNVSVEDVAHVYWQGWRLGLKAMAVYRDGCKYTQPMETEKVAEKDGPPPSQRYKLPRKVKTERLKLKVRDLELYAHVGFYENGQPGELFLTGPNEGTTVNGFLDGMAKQVSLALQHGTPVHDVTKLWRNMSFEPNSQLMPPADSDFTSCSSVLDLLAQELALLCLDPETRRAMGIKTRQERALELEGGVPATPKETSKIQPPPVEAPPVVGAAPVALTPVPSAVLEMPLVICDSCGGMMRQTGSCFSCTQCGKTTGCS